jgi:putative nucleotidyltransferase with HDIG domain
MLPQKVDRILKSVDQMRPMPTSITRILRALEDPMNTAGAISELIGLDQALAASVLQMANSAGLGYNAVCTSLSDAVMRLGFKRVKVLVLGAATSGPLTRRLNGYRLGANELWNHSVYTAVAAQWLSRALHYPDPEEAYVAGLLHDMGKLLLDQYVMVDYNKMVELMKNYNLAMWQVEEHLLGVHHATVGALMAEKWNFPVILVDAIRFHHAPSLARTKQTLPAIINIANAFSNQQHSVATDDVLGKTIHPESLNILHLDEIQVERIKSDMERYMATKPLAPTSV